MDPSGGPKRPCPKCGFQSEVGSPVCGNCGYELGTQGAAPIASTGTGFAKLAVALLVFVALGALLWTKGGDVVDYFEDLVAVDTPSFEVPEIDPDIKAPGNGKGAGSDNVESPYKGVRALAAALNKGGLPCTQVKVDSSDSTISTGSCQAPGEVVRTHVQINIYFQEPSLQAARDIMRERAFNYVHDANWFVVTQLPTARRVHEILGGRLVKAK